MNKKATKLLFVCDDGTALSPTFAEYFMQLGYEAKFAKCPAIGDDLTIFHWADMIFVMNNDIQVTVNVRINPLGQPNPKVVSNLNIPSTTHRAFAPELLMLVDQKSNDIVNFIACNIREGYSYNQHVEDHHKTRALVTLIERHISALEPFCQYIASQITKLGERLIYYSTERQHLIDSLPSDD